MNVVAVYVTVPSGELGRMIARQVVKERLAACGNLLAGVESVFRWESRVVEEQEVVLILKTQSSRIEQLIARIKELHPYDCPCIVVYRAVGGSSDYEAWVAAETEGDEVKLA